MFDPTKHQFSYMLSKYDCFRKLTGKCSLMLTDDEFKKFALKEKPINEEETYEDREEQSVHYCRLLLRSFHSRGILKPVIIHPNSCGHYAFTDGQHRTCIAKTVGMVNIPANISEASSSECRVCYFRKQSIKFRIKLAFGLSDEFTR
ncbi:ParB N-terminal domain-containing protein [Paenibacillus sp. FSL H3-0457]|uniref:ParB N-terminal domain-containing protein n=1 Tax=Paenibacillus sp. FSL H3-0457 TaxID=2921430 RepID=UPI0030EC5B96